MGSNSGIIALICLKAIQCCGGKVRVVLKVPDEELGWISNCAEKTFTRIWHGILVGGSGNLYFLSDFCELKEHCFRFIGYIISKVCNGINDVVDCIYEHISWFIFCVNRHRVYIQG